MEKGEEDIEEENEEGSSTYSTHNISNETTDNLCLYDMIDSDDSFYQDNTSSDTKN